MKKTLGIALALGFACSVWSGSASAQVAGEYDGTSADGQTISITVTFDSGTGFYEVTGATVWYNAACSGLGAGLYVNEGLGWNPQTEFSGGTVAMSFAGNEENILASLKYHPYSNSFTGNIDTRLGALVPNGGRPNKVMKCESDFQPLSLSYMGSAAKAPQFAKGAVVHFTKQAAKN